MILPINSQGMDSLMKVYQTSYLQSSSEDEEENEITIYGEPTSFGEIQKHLEDNGFEITSAEFTRIPNDLKDVTDEERETIDKMVERLEDFDDVQDVYTSAVLNLD